MNILENKNNYENGNYFCTWSAQWYAQNGQDFQQRDAINEEFLFGKDSIVGNNHKEARNSLYLVIDDGWDVPENLEMWDMKFGSLIVDKDRFPSYYSDKPEESLKNLSDKVKSLGFKGLGLWVAVQNSNIRDELDVDFLEYWKERARWCEYAGITYWKCDWGKYERSYEYRNAMTKAVKEVAPNLYIEHSVPGGPTAERGLFPTVRQAEDLDLYRKFYMISDYFRLYDLMSEFANATLFNRLATALSLKPNLNGNCKGVINYEDRVYFAAVLGGAAGVMRCNGKMQEVIRMCKWQEVSPQFSIKDLEFKLSDEVINEAYIYPEENKNVWPFFHGKKIQTAPAVLALGKCELPVVRTSGDEKPYCACSLNPITNTYAIGLYTRTINNKRNTVIPADVEANVPYADKLIGVFGRYASLTLNFNESIEGKRVYIQNMSLDEAIDVTDNVGIVDNTLVISGKLIDKIGKLEQPEGDESEPGLAILIK